ncbi:MAG: hypothetical protein AAB681_01095 [Patescibacteria group bacterium]
MSQITFENFHHGTFAVFKACKRPKRKPDFVSITNFHFKEKISSEYWYGKDSFGEYVIRCSDHWAHRNYINETGNISNCVWDINIPRKTKHNKYFKVVLGKCYLVNFKKRT